MVKLPTPSQDDAILRLDPGMHTALIRRIALSADDGMLATASHDKTVRLWELGSGAPHARLLRTLRPFVGPSDDGKVNAVALAPDASWCAAGGWFTSAGDEFISLFDTGTGAIVERLGPLPRAVHEIEVTADGSRLAAGLGGKAGIRVWRREASWRPLFADLDYGEPVEGLAFAPDGCLYATGLDGRIRAYAPDGRMLVKTAAPGGKRPLGLAISPDGRHVAIGYQDTTRVDVLDAATLRLQHKADTHGLSGGNLAVVAFRRDGALAAAGSHGGDRSPVMLWPDAGQGPRQSLPGPVNTVMDLLPCRDGLAWCSFDPAFGLLAADGTLAFVAPPPMADLRARKFKNFLVSADGKRVRFGLGASGAAPHLIDLQRATLTPAPVSPADLLAADTLSLPIEGWSETDNPKLAGRRLPTRDFEQAHSLAILPRREGFILGTEWRLRRFDARGRHVWRRPSPGPVWCVNTACEGRVTVAAYGDGTVRWHRSSDGSELLVLFVNVDWPRWPEQLNPAPSAWALFKPDGYYTCSPGADDLLGWHVNRAIGAAGEFHAATQFAARFHDPARVSAALDSA